MDYEQRIQEKYEAMETASSAEKIRDALKSITNALECADEVEDLIVQAAEEADGLPVSDEILSYRQDLADIWLHLRKMKERLEKEVA